MPDIPELPQEPGTYALRELYRVTEMRGDAVYRTVSAGLAWVPLSVGLGRLPGSDLMVNSLSTSLVRELSRERISTIKRVLPKKSE